MAKDKGAASVIYGVDDKLPLGTTIFLVPPVYRGRIIYYPGGREKRCARVDDLLQRFEEVGTGRALIMAMQDDVFFKAEG